MVRIMEVSSVASPARTQVTIVCVVLEIELRASCMVGKHCTTELPGPALKFYVYSLQGVCMSLVFWSAEEKGSIPGKKTGTLRKVELSFMWLSAHFPMWTFSSTFSPPGPVC